jgi:hypothetical protein
MSAPKMVEYVIRLGNGLYCGQPAPDRICFTLDLTSVAVVSRTREEAEARMKYWPADLRAECEVMERDVRQ